MFLAVNPIDLQEFLISWPGSHQQTRKFYSYQNNQSEESELSYLRNHHWTHPNLLEIFALFLNWHLYTQKPSYWTFLATAKHYSIPFKNFRRNYVRIIASQTYPPDSSLVHSRPHVNQRKCMHEIKDLKSLPFTNHTLCGCVYIYIYIYI